MSHTARTAAGFEMLATWEDVRRHVASKGALYYWGAMMILPGVVLVRCVLKNGKIRVRGGDLEFTLDAGHAAAGLLYRLATRVE